MMNTRVIQIEGMSCAHCSTCVEKALNSVPGISATVNLENKTAVVYTEPYVKLSSLRQAVEDSGYQVINIE